MNESRLRVGIIGANVNYGWGTRAHIPAIQALPELELVAVCTAHKDTAEETARKYGVPMAFHDYEAMVESKDIDIISVCVRVPRHEQMVMAALRNGKHVFCEWPLGVNSDEAKEMAALADAKGVRHMIGLQARGSPALIQLKELVDGGYVGRVLACSMVSFSSGAGLRTPSNAWALDKAQGVNTLTIAGGHSLDALCYCAGELEELSSIVSTQVKRAAISGQDKVVDVTSPDNVLVSGRMVNGAVASAHIASVPGHGTGFRLEVQGTEGTLVATSSGSVQIGDMELLGGRRGGSGLAPVPIDVKHRMVPDGMPSGSPYNVGQLFHQFADAITNKRPIANDFNLAVRRHHLLDALERASEQGRRQRVVG